MLHMERCTKRHYANTHIKYQIPTSMKSKNGYVAKMLMSAADTIPLLTPSGAGQVRVILETCSERGGDLQDRART